MRIATIGFSRKFGNFHGIAAGSVSLHNRGQRDPWFGYREFKAAPGAVSNSPRNSP